MEQIVRLSHRLSPALLRASLAVTLLWIGLLKFADPAPVVGLLNASLPVLAFDGFVYLLGVLEVAAAVGLLTGAGLPYVGLLLVGLFGGTLTIFVIAPAVTYGEAGFPFLSLAGEFLLKDLVLIAASVAVLGGEPMPARQSERAIAARMLGQTEPIR